MASSASVVGGVGSVSAPHGGVSRRGPGPTPVPVHGAATPASAAAARTLLLLHADVGHLALMRPKLCVVQLLDGVSHVLTALKLHHASPVLEDIGVANISSLPHVILQVLPAATGG